MAKLTQEEIKALVDRAIEYRLAAYAPYSRFKVGAAVLGAVVVGTAVVSVGFLSLPLRQAVKDRASAKAKTVVKIFFIRLPPVVHLSLLL